MNDYVSQLIEMFGGVRPMARAVGVPPSTVASWRRRGRINERYHPAIVAAALGLDPVAVLGPQHFSNLRAAA